MTHLQMCVLGRVSFVVLTRPPLVYYEKGRSLRLFEPVNSGRQLPPTTRTSALRGAVTCLPELLSSLLPLLLRNSTSSGCRLIKQSGDCLLTAT